MGGLQSQLQQVQLERSTLQNRLKTSQAEIDSLQQVRQWYQQQLAMAQEARVRLQSEMANMQVRLMLMHFVFVITYCSRQLNLCKRQDILSHVSHLGLFFLTRLDR